MTDTIAYADYVACDGVELAILVPCTARRRTLVHDRGWYPMATSIGELCGLGLGAQCSIGPRRCGRCSVPVATTRLRPPALA